MNSNKEHRKSKRTPSPDTINISFDNSSGENVIAAEVIDISYTGIGLATTKQLNKDQVVQFAKGHPNWSLPDQGIVVWSMRQNDQFRLGLKFISKLVSVQK